MQYSTEKYGLAADNSLHDQINEVFWNVFEFLLEHIPALSIQTRNQTTGCISETIKFAGRNKTWLPTPGAENPLYATSAQAVVTQKISLCEP